MTEVGHRSAQLISAQKKHIDRSSEIRDASRQLHFLEEAVTNSHFHVCIRVSEFSAMTYSIFSTVPDVIALCKVPEIAELLAILLNSAQITAATRRAIMRTHIAYKDEYDSGTVPVKRFREKSLSKQSGAGYQTTPCP